MRHVFIINPVSGRQDPSGWALPRIRAAAEAVGVEAEVVTTTVRGDGTRLAGEYARGTEGPVRLYAVGGDGTLNEVFAGAYRCPNAEVASVPCGSGNDFVRSYGEPEQFLDLEAQLRGEARTIDLIEVDGGVCAAITSTGLDAEVAYNIPKYRRIPLLGGSVAYNLSVLERIVHPLGKQLRVTMDGRTIEGRYLIATVCNGQTYGGGWRAAPMASLDDGVLEVILVRKVSRLRIAGIISKYKNGRHWADGAVIPAFRDVMEHHRAKEVLIEPTGRQPFILNVDGECGPAPRLWARVLPGAARFVVPRGVAL